MINNNQTTAPQHFQPWVQKGLKSAGIQVLLILLAARFKETLGFPPFSLTTPIVTAVIFGSSIAAFFTAWIGRNDYLETIAKAPNVIKVLNEHCAEYSISNPIEYGMKKKLLVFSGNIEQSYILANPETTGKNADNIFRAQSPT